MKKYAAHGITGLRILSSMLLLFFPVYSLGFYLCYLLCGLTDIADGAVARHFRSASAFGAKFDTVADFMFAATAMMKLLPTLAIPIWLLWWIILIAVMKGTNLIVGFLRRGQLAAVHNGMNKATGTLLFLLPFTFSFVKVEYSAIIVCLMATVSAVLEGYICAQSPQKQGKNFSDSDMTAPVDK